MKIPSDYNEGYPKARETDPEMADNYLAHTHIGDPVAEAMTDDLIDLGESKSWRLIQAAMDDPGGEALRTHQPRCGNSSTMPKRRRNGSTMHRSPRPSACFTAIREWYWRHSSLVFW